MDVDICVCMGAFAVLKSDVLVVLWLLRGLVLSSLPADSFSCEFEHVFRGRLSLVGDAIVVSLFRVLLPSGDGACMGPSARIGCRGGLATSIGRAAVDELGALLPFSLL